MNTTIQAPKKETKKVAPTKANEVKVSDYAKNVISVNALLKQALASVGAVRSLLLEHKELIKLDVTYIDYLTKSLKDKATYEALNSAVRRTKTGKVPPFYVLQALHKLTKVGTVAKVTKTVD